MPAILVMPAPAPMPVSSTMSPQVPTPLSGTSTMSTMSPQAPSCPSPMQPPQPAPAQSPQVMRMPAGATEIPQQHEGCWPMHPLSARPRPSVGDLVMLNTAEPSVFKWALRVGEVGIVEADDGSIAPFTVRGPRGDVDWYEEGDIVCVADRGLSEEVAIAAGQLYRRVSATYRSRATSIISVLLDSHDISGLSAMIQDHELLMVCAADIVSTLDGPPADAGRMSSLPVAQPLSSVDTSAPLPLAQAIPLDQAQSGVRPPVPTPLDSTQVLPVINAMSNAVTPHTMATPHTGSSTPQRMPSFISPSSMSVDTRPTASGTGGTPHSRAARSRDGSSSPSGSEVSGVLGDELFERVRPVAGPLAAKVTHVLIDAFDDESILRSLLAPAGEARLARHVSDAVMALQKLGLDEGVPNRQVPTPAAP